MASPILPFIKIAAAPSRVELEVLNAHTSLDLLHEKTLKEVYEKVHQGSATLTSFGKLEIAGYTEELSLQVLLPSPPPPQFYHWHLG